MKKIITIIAVITLISLSSVFFFSCALFNKGTLDETYGIYGITDAYYKFGDEVFRFGHKYEYFLIIVNENNKATIKYKTIDNKSEVSYEIEYVPTYKGDGNRVVSTLEFKSFKYVRYLPNSNKELVPTEVVINSYSGSYGRFKQGLKLDQYESLRIDDGLKLPLNAIRFERLYDKRTDKYINKAIEKQKEKIGDRATAK